MSESWANIGVDLYLDLAGHRLRSGLEDALRDAVRTGRIHAGARLPSSRGLARDLGIARNTVADAYGQLVAEGWLTARQGSGTRAAERTAAIEPESSPASTDVRRIRHDLRPGSPDLAAFPRASWLAAARRALNSAPDEAFGYPDPCGRPELRDALADYLSRARGVRATSDRIVICSGFAQGLALLCTAMRAQGATSLAVEAYGYQAHRDVATRRGLRLTTLPVGARGAAVDELDQEDMALLTPAHQFPLGVSLEATRRTSAVKWAVDSGGLIIEDDYDGEFRYDRQPVGAMQALAPEHIVYVGTASKSLAPGLRLGWLVLPAHLTDEVITAKTLADRNNSTVDELTLAELITSGSYDRQVRRMRLAYRRRRDRLVAALERHVPHVRITGIAAGLHVLLELPTDRPESEAVSHAARHGVAVSGLSEYGPAELHRRPALVVGYGTPPEHAFTEAVARLCAALGH